MHVQYGLSLDKPFFFQYVIPGLNWLIGYLGDHYLVILTRPPIGEMVENGVLLSCVASAT